jgi:hypothetical protein
MPTVSEQLFEDYCSLRGYAFKRIEAVVRKGRFPDYWINTQRGTVICEVKEIIPNAEDKAFDERFRKYGHADSSCSIGKRARAALVDASVQLKRFEYDPRPCMAVIFDRTYRDYLSPATLTQRCSVIPSYCFRPTPQIVGEI